MDDIFGSLIWITMDAGQCFGKLMLRTMFQEWTNGLDRPHTHSRGTAAGKKAKDHFFPQAVVILLNADGAKLRKAITDLVRALAMRVSNFFERYGLSGSFHVRRMN